MAFIPCALTQTQAGVNGGPYKLQRPSCISLLISANTAGCQDFVAPAPKANCVCDVVAGEEAKNGQDQGTSCEIVRINRPRLGWTEDFKGHARGEAACKPKRPLWMGSRHEEKKNKQTRKCYQLN